jgi:hypothetical protein
MSAARRDAATGPGCGTNSCADTSGSPLAEGRTIVTGVCAQLVQRAQTGGQLVPGGSSGQGSGQTDANAIEPASCTASRTSSVMQRPRRRIERRFVSQPKCPARAFSAQRFGVRAALPPLLWRSRRNVIPATGAAFACADPCFLRARGHKSGGRAARTPKRCGAGENRIAWFGAQQSASRAAVGGGPAAGGERPVGPGFSRGSGRAEPSSPRQRAKEKTVPCRPLRG